MIGLTVSKYRIWYERQDCIQESQCYIADRSLFYEDLDSLIEEAENTLAHYGQKMYEEKAFGYQCYDLKKHVELELLKNTLVRHRAQIQWADLKVKPCLSKEKIQNIVERTKQLVIKGCNRKSKKPYTIDRSKVEEWISENPYCVAREKWEALAYKVCGDINIKVSVKDRACDLAYIVTSEEVDCSIQYALESYEKNCDIEFKVTYEEWENSGCRTSYEDCKYLNKCGISFDHIIGMQRCGIKTSYDTKNNCPEISFKGKTISFDSLEIGKDFDAKQNCSIIGQLPTN